MQLHNKPNWPGWEITEILGKGSYGTVYKIEKTDFTGTEYAALKVITVPHSTDELHLMRHSGMDNGTITRTLQGQVSDILNEYKLMKQLRDIPGIVHCDRCEHQPHADGMGWDIYIQMELLTPFLRQDTIIRDEGSIITFGRELCEALAACQERGIIHRDIKPQNVFVTDTGHYKLGDFGIARTAERTTTATARAGTVSFMAPEVYTGERYNQSVDIYSLGMMLYWLLNEQKSPFLREGFTIEDSQYKRFHGEPLPAPKNGSEALKRVVLKACAFDPKERFASAAEMLCALNALEQPIPEITVPVEASPVQPSAPSEDSMDETVGLFGARAAMPVPAETGSEPEPELPAEPPRPAPQKPAPPPRPAVPVRTAQRSAPVRRQTGPGGVSGMMVAVLILAAILLVCAFWSRLTYTGWRTSSGSKYYYDSGTKLTGLHTLAGSTYYFNEDGQMQTGWQTIDGDEYYFCEDGSASTYRVDIGSATYCFDSTGKKCSGWVNYNGELCYFSPSRNGAAADGKWQIEEDYYYFDDGYLQTGTVSMSDGKYHFDDEGRFQYVQITEFDLPFTVSEEYETFPLKSGSGEYTYNTLKKQISNCYSISISLDIQLTESGDPDGTWQFWVLDQFGQWTTPGEWAAIGEFQVRDGCGNFTAEFDDPFYLENYACIGYDSGDWKGSFHVNIDMLTYRSDDFGTLDGRN